MLPLQVWDAVTGAELFSLTELANSVSFCHFLSNGEKIIAVSDASVKVMFLMDERTVIPYVLVQK